MIRGTTPTLTFTFPFQKENLKNLSLVFCQRGLILLEKKLEDVEITDNILSVQLSQEETLSFWARFNISIQIRCVTKNDEAFASQIITTSAERILKDGVL
jgi:hypothetical protein